MENEQKEMKIEEIQAKINDILDLNEMEALIKSNQVEFDLEGKKYRVCKPSFAQKQEVYSKKSEKFIELLRNDNLVLENDLKKMYFKKNIDIDKMTRELQAKIQVRDGLMLELGKAIKEEKADFELKNYKVEIEKLNSEIQAASIYKTQLLQFSIENQVLIYTYSYLTFLTAEKKEGETWVRVWTNYEDFKNDKENLVNKFSYYVTMLTSIEEL